MKITNSCATSFTPVLTKHVFHGAPITLSRTAGTTILFILAAIPLLVYLLREKAPAGLKLVPGPANSLPWIGRIHGIDPKAPWFAMKKWADEYAGVFRLIACGETHIWIGDPQVAYDLLNKKAAIYSSRPPVHAVPGSATMGQYLPLLEYGDRWRKQRKFAHTVLTNSHNVAYHGYITLEARKYLYGLLMDPTDHYAQTDRFCGRVAARLGWGHPEPAASLCKNAIEFISHISPGGSITNLLPFLGKLPEWLNPSIKHVRQRREKERILWKGLLQEAQKERDAGSNITSYANAYFERKEAGGGERSFGFDDEEAAYAVGMLCTVAIFTIGGPLYCFMLVMVLYPEWQERVRNEVDTVVGDRIVEIGDSPKLHTLRAVIKECIRWRPPVPLGVPRLLEEDDTYKGYFIPKGAIIHAVELSVSRDPINYPHPETFNPARWLEPSYPSYREPLTEHPRLMGFHGFGRGRRVCPGVDLTEAELLVACGSLVWGFEMHPNVNRKGEKMWPDDRAFSQNVIGGPRAFEFDLRVRSEDRRGRIVGLYEESFGSEGRK